MSPIQALNNLYQAARSVNATAEIHEAIKQSYAILLERIDGNTGDIMPKTNKVKNETSRKQ